MNCDVLLTKLCKDIIPDGFLPLDTQSSQSHQNNNSNPLLNNDENNYLNSFFENPDALDAGASLMDMNMGGLYDQKTENNTYNFSGGYDGSSGTTSGTSFPVDGTAHSNILTHGLPIENAHMGSGSNLLGDIGQFGDIGSHEDLNGASTLFSLASNNQHSQAQALYNSHAGYGARWGNFGMNAPAPSLHSPLESSSGPSGRASAGSSYTPNYKPTQSHSGPFGGNTSAHAHPQILQNLQNQAMQKGGSHSRHNSLSLDTSSGAFFPQIHQQQHNYNLAPSVFPHNQQTRPSMMMRFGSDSNFVQNGYRPGGFIPSDEEKADALMGHAAALGAWNETPDISQVTGFRSAPLQQPQRQQIQQRNQSASGRSNSMRSSFTGLPYQSTSAGAQMQRENFGMDSNQVYSPQDDEDEDGLLETTEERPRKRRKSGLEQQRESDMSPTLSARSHVPRRGPKVPKAESLEDDAEFADVYATPTNNPAPTRRKSTVGRNNSLASSNTSTPPSAGPDSTGGTSSTALPGGSSRRKGREPKNRQNLTEEQKRSNHIASEQKRRNIIKQGYHDLDILIPSLSGGKSGLSKSEVLKETILYLEATIAGNKTVRQLLEDDGTSGGGTSSYAASLGGAFD